MNNWTPGQKLFATVFRWWDSYYDEPPEVNEERIWQIVALRLPHREASMLELLFGKRFGYPLTLEEAGELVSRARHDGFGLTRSGAYALKHRALLDLGDVLRTRTWLKEVVTSQTADRVERHLQAFEEWLRRQGLI